MKSENDERPRWTASSMDIPSRSSRNALACDACRAKKLKVGFTVSRCDPDPGAARDKEEKRQNRTWLLIRHLSNVENRLRRLETLFAQRLPDVDIEQALETVKTDDEEAATDTASPADVRRSDTRAPPPPPSQQQQSIIRTSSAQDEGSRSIVDAVPEGPDGFDWQEDANELADGMATLSVEPKGTGYLGSTAGVFFLRSLLFWMGNPQFAAVAPRSGLDGAGALLASPTASSHLSQARLTRDVLGRLMDAYFRVYHQTYPFIHEATFRAQWHEVIPRPQRRSWQMLLYSVLAIGAWCMDDRADDGALENDLYHQAVAVGQDESESMFESANLTFVQALVLLSNLSQKRDKPNTGSNFLGLAVRMALSLGLHRELPDWDIHVLQREMRRRVWWGLFIFDSGASTTFGRPILLPGPEVMDVKPVLNVADELLTGRTTVIPGESQGPTVYSGLKAQSDFHLQSNHISNALLAASGVSTQDALAMNHALDGWSETVPAYFRLSAMPAANDEWYLFARSRLWWRFWNLKIILFRQLLLRRAVERNRQTNPTEAGPLQEQAIRIAVDAAQATITSIHDHLATANITRLTSWYSV
ncbi:c6 zinc finger domain containing protein [Niveomyces insectorum RCEF 264]|uniref:C6 zinc finger domain containing protein n=1 Tax=Niveomyces insectorum RCEF 264 TaxID=1081102 RepID=A0A167Z062_9HYPO|nr:c6 zinc finger domain containing protein [Niveomyces insectorum RCEF 264]